MAARGELPAWVNLGLIPLLNLMAAFLVSGLIVLLLGENPIEAVRLLIFGAFGYGEAIGYTLFYATNFIFTGLAVAIAFHCGLFNIGGEGQAYVAGLGVTLVGLYLGFLPFILVVPIAIIAAAACGGFWAFIPGWLQARRGSHVVITTIMFNFIAAALMTYMVVNVLIKPGS
ncbi:MAG: ABC transporter permease, partial [Geminicoccaceae bacterium]